ncbi:FecR family protein [Pedobacter faecalis]|uniref:FecR family protein n=1 Tax=Pedobacter faecalis TaxID=3041495 RepID=UPI002550AE79|nr:FecR domain-containing protein [Pedobacter sp. ELA7]
MNGNFDRAYLQELACKWKKGQLTDQEWEYLRNWDESMLDDLLLLPDSSGGPDVVKSRMLNKVLAGMLAEARGESTEIDRDGNGLKDKQPYKLWPRIVAVAAAVATIVFGLWFFNDQSGRHSDDRRNLIDYASDVAPGNYGATITLADGKTIVLDSEKKGVVVGAELRYEDGSEVGSSRTEGRDLLRDRRSLGSLEMTEARITAATANGQTYAFTLPDGTKVWLNAASKIEFPISFKGLVKREVIVSGEAYFEVFRDKAQPFVVNTKNLRNGQYQRVEVLGTHFNINAYGEDGAIKTTLLEGSVSVSSLRGGTTRQPQLLKPNQQSVFTNQIKIQNVDAENAVAWKEGNFMFDHENLESAMNKIARWYNVQLEYKDNSVKQETFYGKFSRFDKLSTTLKTLERTGVVKFEITGNKVIIDKK